MAQLRPKIVKLAKIIGGVTGITTRIDENAPEYYCMAGILTDEEADVAIAAGLRKERTAAYLARKVGKTVQEVQPLLDNLVYYGIFRRSHNEALGEDTYNLASPTPADATARPGCGRYQTVAHQKAGARLYWRTHCARPPAVPRFRAAVGGSVPGPIAVTETASCSSRFPARAAPGDCRTGQWPVVRRAG